MLSKSTQYKKIMEDYDRKQLMAHTLLNRKKKYIYKHIPEIKQIEDKLSLTGIEITKLIIQKPDNSNILIENLKKRNRKLIEKKQNLLLKNGFKKDFLEVKYTCNKCKDTGYINNKPCNCLKQQFIDYCYDQSNVKEILLIENFTTFDINYYSDEIDEETNKSPKQNMCFIYNIVQNYIKDFEQHKDNLVFYGDTGLGKTFLCNCIAKEILDRGHTVLYLTSFKLFHIFEKYKFDHNSEINYKAQFDYIFNTDLLIIDDLGTELNTTLTGVELFNCINTRILNNKATIISTNLSPNDWKKQYSDRIVSRILGHYKLLKFFGKDIRPNKKFNENTKTS